MLLDMNKLGAADDGTVSNAQLGAALRVMANADLATSRPRIIALLGSRYMADNPQLWEDATVLLEGAVVEPEAAE